MIPYLEQLEIRECLSGDIDWWRDHLCRLAPGAGGVIGDVELSPGWATFGQVVPQGAAYEGVRVGVLETQADVKTRWPDGSIRLAVMTAYVPVAGTYTLTAGSALADEDFNPEPSYAGIGFLTDGSLWATGQWLATAHSTPWLQGPLVVEQRYSSPVYAFDGATEIGSPHPWLSVIFDVRTYRDGARRIDVTVENTGDQAGGMLRYAVGVLDLDEMWFYRDYLEHPYLTRWRKTYEAAGTFAHVQWAAIDAAYAAGALPQYWDGVSPQVDYVGGTDFEPLGRGSLNPFMPEHGGRPELAPYPDWSARFLVHQNSDQRQFVLAHGDLAGSWPVHVRNPDGSLVSIDERPNYWLDPLGRFEDGPRGAWWQTGPLTPDNDHQPSLAYIPYLLTGDRYYADEMAFWANYCLLSTFQESYYDARGGSLGLLHPNQTRGIAWALRNLTDAAAYLPDDDPLKSYFAEKVRNNLNWFDAHAAGARGPLGVGWHTEYLNPYFDPGATYRWVSLWMHEAVGWAIGHARDQGFAGGSILHQQVIDFQVRNFSDPQTRIGAEPYYLAIGTQSQYFTTIRQAIAVTGPSEFAGYYGVYARLTLLAAGPAGTAALDWLMARPGMWEDLMDRAGWAFLG